MIERDVGIGIMPAAAAVRYQQIMSIKSVALRDAWATRLLLICVRNENALPRHTRQLIEQLKSTT